MQPAEPAGRRNAVLLFAWRLAAPADISVTADPRTGAVVDRYFGECG